MSEWATLASVPNQSSRLFVPFAGLVSLARPIERRAPLGWCWSGPDEGRTDETRRDGGKRVQHHTGTGIVHLVAAKQITLGVESTPLILGVHSTTQSLSVPVVGEETDRARSQ